MHRFRLSPRASGRGVSCDVDGAFVESTALLKRMSNGGKDDWVPRDCDEISAELSARYGLPVDVSSKANGLAAIANALNAGDLARAQLVTIFLRIPEAPPLEKHGASREALIQFIRELHESGLLKIEWNPDDHPRWPKYSPDSQGGRFAPKGTQAGEPGLGHNQGPPLEEAAEREAAEEGSEAALAEFGPVAAAASAMLLATTEPLDSGEEQALDEIDRHHSWPKYLGGAPKQPLTELPKSLHIEYHKILDDVAERWFGTNYYKNLEPGQKAEIFKEVIRRTKEFDARYGTHLYDDMIRNGFPVIKWLWAANFRKR